MASNSAVPIAENVPLPQAPKRRGWKPFGLREQPFFEDKDRAFWILQSAGWAGYFLLRILSLLSNVPGDRVWSYVLHTALLTATGYSITLLMASAFRRLIKMKPVYTWVGSIMLVGVAAAGFSAIETWSIATFVNSEVRPEGLRLLGAILFTVSLLIAWSALSCSIFRCSLPGRRFITASTSSFCSRSRRTGCSGSKARPPTPSWRCFATSSTRISCSTR